MIMNNNNNDLMSECHHDFFHEKLEKALSALGMRYWEYDIKTKRLYRSALIQNEVGYSAYKDNVPESYVEEGIIHPSYAGAYLDFYHNLERGIDGRLVFQSKYSDGHWGWLDITYKLRYDSQGKPDMAFGIGGNISRYSGIAVFKIKNGRLSLSYSNDAFYQITGFTQEEYIEKPEYCFNFGVDSESRKIIDNEIQQGILTGNVQTVEYPFRRKDGQMLYVSHRFAVVPQRETGVYLVPALIADITERHNADKKLADERNMYQSLLNESSSLITVVDAETYEILYANRATLEATKHLEAGYVGNVCYRCIHHAETPCADCILAHCNSYKEEAKEEAYGGRFYRRTYKIIKWNERKALLECSEDITEQRNSMRLAEENAEQQKRIINNIPTGIIVFRIVNGKYSIEQVNPAACRILNMDADAAMKAKDGDILKLIHPDDVQIVRDAVGKLSLSECEEHYEFRNLNRKNGSYTWTAAEAKSAVQPDGSMLVFFGYSDITARREKEDEFKRRLDTLANMDDDNLIAKGRHNLTKNRVIDYYAKVAYAANINDCVTYDDAVKALISKVSTKKKQDEITVYTSRKNLLAQYENGITDGAIEFSRLSENRATAWSVVKYSLVEEPETHDIIVIMYSYDITERVRESRLISKIGSIEYDLLGIVDVRTRQYFLYNQMMNKKGDVMSQTGDFDKARERRIRQYIGINPEDDLAKSFTINNIVNQLKNKDNYSILYTTADTEGNKYRKRFQFCYLDETMETILFFRSDITEMYEKEQKQLKAVEMALETAKKANQSKTEFFSRMSHDMRTPMNGILGLAKLSAEENDAETLRENIKKIYESGEYLLGLINDTLDFQRIESGKLKLEPQIVYTQDVVSGIVNMIQPAAEEKGINLVVTNDNADLNWFVRVDPMRIKQIFLNLLSNAVKFTPSGGTVEFSFHMLSREGMTSHDVVIIRDTGVGMSEEFLQNGIFRPFSQENNAVTSQYAGSGLGLSIAKSLVELMGGHIEVESELGVGTAFSVYLDFERIDESKVRNIKDKISERKQSVSEVLKGTKILLVEDHPLNAEIAIRLLKKVGCEVNWVKNGAEAVSNFENIEGNIYDIVLMDIRMPVMDGLEATRRIRAMKSPYAESIPIIAMTANAYEEDINNSRNAGMSDHLSKPIELDNLYNTLMRFVSEK